MKVERTFDYDLIMSIAAMPEFDVCIEDGMTLDRYEPSKSSAWLLVTDNNDIISLTQLKPLKNRADRIIYRSSRISFCLKNHEN